MMIRRGKRDKRVARRSRACSESSGASTCGTLAAASRRGRGSPTDVVPNDPWRNPMNHPRSLVPPVCRAIATAFVAGTLLASGSAAALDNVKMMIPANPGGGWDQTGRALAAAMQSAKVVQSVQFENKGGAAGTIGLAQFVNSAKGDPNALIMGGMVMVGGIALQKSPVNLTMVTPVARLTSEYLVVVVPASSPHKTMADLVNAFKADPGKVSWHGGSAGGSDHILAGLIAKAVGVDPAKIN